MTTYLDGATAASLLTSNQSPIEQWNRTDVPFDSSKLVHHFFDEQASLTPDKAAVVCRGETLSYAALRDKADRLSCRLRWLGVGPDTIVAISMERSLDMIVAILATLKAGGAYLPLDLAFPAERIAFMLADSGARVILTQNSLKNRFEQQISATVVTVDQPDDDVGAAEMPALDVPASSLAYLMYTSGSTGTPKGVMVEHRNVVNLFAGMDRVIGTEPGVWLAVTSISFDISVLELLWTLARGFTVVLQTGEESLIATGEHSTAAQIRRHGVTHFQCTPTLARALIQSADTLAAMKQLRRLFLGGEALPLSLAIQLGEALGATAIFNMYGPTETTVWSTTHRLTKSAGSVPIGRPIANTRLYVVDDEGELAPVGAIGELYIGGEGVTRGYWRRPELTAERFVPNSFEPARKGLLYRTGDLVRYRDNGDLEFIGRADQQVKIRGFRIELGEIETVLGSHPSVNEAVAVARRDKNGNPQLVAYVVSKQGLSLSAQELRTFARNKLPEYMIPSVIGFLSRMPLTPNGKTDRKALPNPALAIVSENENYRQPGSELESIIAELWQDALGLDSVGLHINIFDLGANSLSVAEVATSLRQRLKREIPLTDFFAYPTIAELAAHLSGLNGASGTAKDHSNRGAARRQALLARATQPGHGRN